MQKEFNEVNKKIVGMTKLQSELLPLKNKLAQPLHQLKQLVKAKQECAAKDQSIRMLEPEKNMLENQCLMKKTDVDRL